MNDAHKTKAQLIKELVALRQRNAELEAATSSHGRRDEHGSVLGVVSVAEDTAAYKQVETRLRESESQLRSLLEDAIQPVFIQRGGRFLYANQALADLFGLDAPHDILQADSILDLIAPHERPGVIERIKTRLEQGAPPPRHREIQALHRDGTLFWVEYIVTVVPWDGESADMVTILDISARKLAEEQLAESEARFRRIVNDSMQGIGLIQEGLIEFVNPAAVAIFGYDCASDMIGQPYLILAAPHEHERLEGYRIVRERGEPAPSRYEYRARRADGELIWVQSLVTRIRRNDQLITLVFFEDATVRRVLETRLRASEAMLGLFIEYMPAAMAMFDREMRYLSASQRWMQDYSLSKAVIGQSHYEVFPEIPERWKAVHRRCLSGEMEYAAEDRFDRADGSVMWLKWEVRPWFDNTGAVGGIIIFSEDITARKEAEEQLQASEARFRDLVEGSIQGVLIYQYDKTVFVNASFVEMFGYDRPSDIYQLPSLLEIIDPTDHERMLQYRDNRVAGQEAPSHYEFQGVQRDGSRIWLDLMARVVSWDGAPAIQVTVFDKTASKAAEEALRQSDRLSMLGRLAATFSHEVRNPLQSLRLYAEILEEEVNDFHANLPSASRETIGYALEVIREQATRMSDIVQDYLSLARLSSMSREPQEMGAFIAGVAREQQERLARHGLTFHLEGVDNLGVGLIHAGAFRRVLLNIMQNAMEAMSGAGCLTVRCGRIDDHLQIVISDTGPGIGPEALSEIFTPFHTTKPEGTGLGLYVVQEIIHAHDGEIRVHSELGQGTTFTITLPQAPGPGSLSA